MESNITKQIDSNGKELYTWKDANGWNIEVYKDCKLIDWRCGLTKTGFNKYEKNYQLTGYLSEGTKDDY